MEPIHELRSLEGRGEGSFHGEVVKHRALGVVFAQAHSHCNSQPRKSTFPKALVACVEPDLGIEEVLPPCGHFL